jgi:hypothetical protein
VDSRGEGGIGFFEGGGGGGGEGGRGHVGVVIVCLIVCLFDCLIEYRSGRSEDCFFGSEEHVGGSRSMFRLFQVGRWDEWMVPVESSI